jgi:nicotinamide-nucleotide amidase
LANGIREKFSTDFSVSITGIAGPDGGTDEKPVGTVWIGVSSARRTIALKRTFGNIREHNIRRSSLAALNMLRVEILNDKV